MAKRVLSQSKIWRKYDLTGQQFGRLTVLQPAPTKLDKNNKIQGGYWSCKCVCGNSITTKGGLLLQGKSRSCGCGHKESITKHGQYKTKAYRAWADMLNRCRNPRHRCHHHYGGRGIYVCDRWSSFQNFLEDMGHPPIGFSLERKDNSGPYSPENCIWTDHITQMNNTRRCVLLTYNGQTNTITQWARKLDVNTKLLRRRYERGWPTEKILTMPSQTPNRIRTRSPKWPPIEA